MLSICETRVKQALGTDLPCLVCSGVPVCIGLLVLEVQIKHYLILTHCSSSSPAPTLPLSLSLSHSPFLPQAFLSELHTNGRLTSASLWKDLYPRIAEDGRYHSMLGQPGVCACPCMHACACIVCVFLQ